MGEQIGGTLPALLIPGAREAMLGRASARLLPLLSTGGSLVGGGVGQELGSGEFVSDALQGTPLEGYGLMLGALAGGLAGGAAPTVAKEAYTQLPSRLVPGNAGRAAERDISRFTTPDAVKSYQENQRLAGRLGMQPTMGQMAADPELLAFEKKLIGEKVLR